MIDDAMHWHASMLQNIVERENHPDMESARQLGTLDQSDWRQLRTETKCEANQRLSQCKRLAMERYTKKRKYEDMSATEQQTLVNVDTNK